MSVGHDQIFIEKLALCSQRHSDLQGQMRQGVDPIGLGKSHGQVK